MGGSSEHIQITGDAARAAGIGPAGIEALQDAAIEPDRRETNLVNLTPGHPWLLTPDPDTYTPEHHFDRVGTATNAQSFEQAASYLRARRDACGRLAERGEYPGAMSALGESVHALQDLFAHSNLVELAPDEQRECLDAVWRGGRTPSSRLKLTAYAPNAREPGKPVDDYGHDAHSKDWKDFNADAKAPRDLAEVDSAQLMRRKQELMKRLLESSSAYQKRQIKDEMQRITRQLEPRIAGSKPPTHYELARSAAVDATRELLDQVRLTMRPERWNALTQADR